MGWTRHPRLLGVWLSGACGLPAAQGAVRRVLLISDGVVGSLAHTTCARCRRLCGDVTPGVVRYRHPNIVSLIGVVSTSPIYIILELCLGGELLDLLRKDQALNAAR